MKSFRTTVIDPFILDVLADLDSTVREHCQHKVEENVLVEQLIYALQRRQGIDVEVTYTKA
jgi:hypothetical protein